MTVNASEAVEVVGTSSNGQVSSALNTSTDGSGNAGSLNITTSCLSVHILKTVTSAPMLSEAMEAE